MSKAFTNEDAPAPEVVVPPRQKIPPPRTAPLEQLRGEGKARLGARVTLADEEGRRSEYLLVGAGEADPAHGAVSVDSPIGRALLGKLAGDEVTVDRPRGPVDYTVVSVTF